MLLRDVLCKRKPKPYSILLAGTHKRLKRVSLEWIRLTRSGVANSDFNLVIVFGKLTTTLGTPAPVLADWHALRSRL